MKKLRAGLVGYGVMGKNHARILSTLDNVDFVGVVDPLEFDKKMVRSNGVPIFGEVSELVAQKIDYAVIAVPTEKHKEVTIQLLNEDVNCLVEKPVTVDVGSALEIKKIAESKSLIVGVGHIERYNSAIQVLKSKLSAGELGDIYQISTSRQGPFSDRISDVGVVRDLATHDIDLCLWLTESKFESIYARTLKKTNRQYEDMVSVTGLMNKKIIVNLIVNWLSPVKERNILIIGEKGAFQVSTLTSELTFFANGKIKVTQDSISHFKGVTQGDITTFSFDKKEPLAKEHEEFRNKILGLDAEIVSLDQGIETMIVTDAILKSSNEKIEVRF
jgi:UDP-N-acetylglucosamine 3-dehydrogenase